MVSDETQLLLLLLLLRLLRLLLLRLTDKRKALTKIPFRN